MINPLYLEILGAIVRWAMTAIGSYLVTHHVLTADLADSLTRDVVRHAIIAAPLVGALALSIWQKIRSSRKLAGTVDQLDDALRAARGAQSV
jgi:hypothetical protein